MGSQCWVLQFSLLLIQRELKKSEERLNQARISTRNVEHCLWMKKFINTGSIIKLLAIATINIGFCNGSAYVDCIESEKQARFKEDLIDPSNRLASWNDDGDCCTWAGVVCSNFTGHVLELHLGNPYINFLKSLFDHERSTVQLEAANEATTRSMLGGKVNPSLLDLKHLNYLDLAWNNFGVEIPRFIGSMENLRYLSLSGAGFVGMIPHQLGNLSNLRYLDLGSNWPALHIENFSWLLGLSLLKYLDLSNVLLNKSFDWLQVINTLSSLQVLKLSECELYHLPQLPFVNMSSLVTLDLTGNSLNHIAVWIFSLGKFSLS